ncbi:Integrator complex subunit 9 [Cichlidogyrus casuarinus]|uniref:Integrator complex subunit 9 n=1 Tax=Cichlidogyrus casuarinus TaxID=1844966 RepID=A0ABD2QCI3_9PLAT
MIFFLNLLQLPDIAWSEVDVVCISNTKSFFGLPYLCKFTDFDGLILVTEPVMTYGKLLIEDALDAFDQLPSNIDDEKRINSKEIRKGLEQAIKRLTLVSYSQPISVFEVATVTAFSSGHEIGGCNWIIEVSSDKIGYISHSSILYSHAQPFNPAPFSDVDVLILGTALIEGNEALESTVRDFCTSSIKILSQGGYVLVPILPCGLIFDLLECVHVALKQHKSNAFPTEPGENGHQKQVNHCPLLLVSSQANASLKYATIFGEWLNTEKASVLFEPECPFIYPSLIEDGSLVPLASLSSTFGTRALKTEQLQGDQDQSSVGFSSGVWPNVPSVIFASHPSLRFGPAAYLAKALAYGDVHRQMSNRIQCDTKAPVNGIFLVESDSYLPRRSGENGIQEHEIIDKIFEPFAMKTKFAPENGQSILGPNVVLKRFNMSAQVGGQQITELLNRCGCPKLALVAPHEILEHVQISLPSNPAFSPYSMCKGVRTELRLKKRCEKLVSFSDNLMQQLRPINVTKFLSKQQEASMRDPRVAKPTPSMVAFFDATVIQKPNCVDGGYALEAPINKAPAEVHLYKTNPVVDANSVIDALTMKGVTGAKLVTEQALIQRALALVNSIRPSSYSSISPSGESHDIAVITFVGYSFFVTYVCLIFQPNPNNLLFLSSSDVHLICSDEATRNVINSVLFDCVLGKLS